jgi:transposase
MRDNREIFVGLNLAKARDAVAIAEDRRWGEVRYMGEISSDATSVRRR